MDEHIWNNPPRKIELHDNAVHIWRLRLSNYHKTSLTYREILAPDEIIRADRFYFAKDNLDFTISRAFLRIILAKYLNKEPEKLSFKYNKHGKPELADEFFQTNITFNLSHSGDLALYAVSSNRHLGIDVELVREKVAYKEICVRFFSPNEVKTLCALPDSLHKEAFFNCWTRKEAYIKARGKGLAIPLNQFDVSLVPGEPARLLDTRDDPESLTKFSLYNLEPGAGYKAALVAEGHNLAISTWETE